MHITKVIVYNMQTLQLWAGKELFVVSCLFFFLNLFILQAIYIVLQDLKMKMLFVELNIRLQE